MDKWNKNIKNYIYLVVWNVCKSCTFCEYHAESQWLRWSGLTCWPGEGEISDWTYCGNIRHWSTWWRNHPHCSQYPVEAKNAVAPLHCNEKHCCWWTSALHWLHEGTDCCWERHPFCKTPFYLLKSWEDNTCIYIKTNKFESYMASMYILLFRLPKRCRLTSRLGI